MNFNENKINNFKYLPFNIQWLDSSYQQSCLPDSPWQKILEEFEPALANRTRQQFNNPQRRQILIELLGKQFQQKFFRFEPDLPYILLPPYMSEEHRHKLENEAKSWLQIQIFKSAIEIGAVVTENENINQLSNNMKNFLEYTYKIICKSLERYLYKIQQKEINKQEEQILEKIKSQNQFIDHSKLRSIVQDSKINFQKLPIINKSHSITSQYSDIISNSIVSLLKHDLRRVILIKEKLFGQQLPIKLRQFIWTECLFRFENKLFDYDFSFVEFQTRRNFVAGITRGKNELKLKSPSNTPIKNLIENAVIETYSKVHSFNPYLEKHHLRYTIKILNILYTYKKIYESYFIYWLLPFQLSYNDEINKDEEIYVITMHFELFIRHCFPKWSNIFTIAYKIMLDLSINDQEFYNHLKKISKINININQNDFIRKIISLENSNELISDPIIFLRKWISEIFVSILNLNSILYLWDQFFITKWNIIYIEYATKAILYLLRDCFMYAKDYNEMRKVFLDEPCLLYTYDIQKAFIHLSLKNYDPKYIPTMNQRLYPFKFTDNIQYISNFQRIGIKDISLNLIIHKNFQKEFKYKTLIVEIQIYGDKDKLEVISTKSIPIIRKQQLVHNCQNIILDIPNEKLILSITKTNQSFIPTPIQALVIVHQRLNATLKTLGYCRFPLYIPKKIGNLDTWDVTFGLVKRALHPGIPPLSIDTIPDIPKTFVSDKIGPGSTISLIVFDPKAEQDFN